MEDKKFALLIDSDNISSKYISVIIDEMTKYGTVTYKRIYGDWTTPQSAKWKTELIKNSITAISYTGMNTLPILLWNKFPIVLLQTVIGKFTNVLTLSSSPVALFASIIPAVVSIVVCLIAGRIQEIILPITLGKKPAPKH